MIGPEPENPSAYSPDWAEAGGNELLLEAARRHLVQRADGTFGEGDVILFRFRKNVLNPDFCRIEFSRVELAQSAKPDG